MSVYYKCLSRDIGCAYVILVSCIYCYHTVYWITPQELCLAECLPFPLALCKTKVAGGPLIGSSSPSSMEQAS